MIVNDRLGSDDILDIEVNQELDECKETVTANLRRDIEVRASNKVDLEQLCGPGEM